MPKANQTIGQTNPKSGTMVSYAHRLQGLTLKIPAAAVVTQVSNNRIVSIQEDSNGIMYAVISPVALADHTIIGFGVLEEALQSGGLASIAPSPNTFVDGDTVVVLRYPMEVYMIDVDPSNPPVHGIGTAYMDTQGRLSSSAAGDNLAITGSVFSSVPGVQMANQLKTNTVFYQPATSLHP